MDWSSSRILRYIPLWLIGVGLAGTAGSLSAITYTYSGTTAGDRNWSTDVGWGVVPVSAVTTDLVFGGTLAAGVDMGLVQDIADPFLLNSLTFNTAGAATGVRATVVIKGDVLQFSADGGVGPSLVMNATGTTGGAEGDLRPLLVIESDVVLDAVLGVSGTSIGWISGDVSGVGGINKTGSSTFILSGDNSFDGDVVISGASSVLDVRSGTALGSTVGETRVTGGGQLLLRDGVSVGGEVLRLSGSGGSSGATQGALRSISGDNSWDGPIYVDTSVVTRLLVNVGTMTLNGPLITAGSVANGLVFQGEGNFFVKGALTGNAQVTRSSNGAGTVYFSGDNGTDDPVDASQILGKLTVSNGEVVFEKRHSFYYKVAGVDVPIWTGANLAVAAGKAIGFNVGGAGEFTEQDIADVNAAVASSGISNGVQLWLDTTNAAGGIFTYGQELKDWGGGSLALNKRGVNTLVLTEANSYSGVTTVDAGILRITDDDALGTTVGKTVVRNGGTLELYGGITVTGETLDLLGSGVSGNGALRSAGGHNVWAGDINANTSVITRIGVISAADSLTITGNVTTAGTDPNGFVVQGNGKTTITGDITGDGSFVRSSNGNGVAVLTGNNTYSGRTLISNGTLQVGDAGVGNISGTSGVFVSGGRLAGSGVVGGMVNLNDAAGALLTPGDSGGVDVGMLTLAGGLTLHDSGGADLRFDLGEDSDLIKITGGSFIGNSSGLTTFDFVTGAGFGIGTYDLIDWSVLGLGGALGVDVGDFNYTGLVGYEASFSIEPTGILRLTVVPEPSRVLLVLLGGMGLLWRRGRA